MSEPSVDVVASEIRVVVGRVRSPAGLAEADLPVLDRLAGGREHVPAMIADAIERIPAEPYRDFLSTLLPFPFEPAAPWEQLGPNRRSDGRGERASRAAFGLSWDACNRPGQLLDGRSRRDWAEQFLAESVLAGDAATAAAPEAGPEAEAAVETATEAPGLDPPFDPPAEAPVEATVDDGHTERSVRGRRGLLVGAAAVLVLAAGAVAWVVARDGSATASSPTTTSSTQVEGESISCAPIGALDSSASQDPAAAALSERLIDLYHSLPESTGCPSDPAFLWGELAVQEVASGEDDLPGALLVERNGTRDVYLTPTAYTRYRTLGSGDGSVAQDLGGLPGDVATLPDGHQEVELSKGVLFVAETEGAPFFWVPADFVPLYRVTPQLGFPVGNPLAKLEQDYQHGFGRLYQKDNLPELTFLDAPGAELPAIEELARTVLRQSDGTAWWIAADGRRYWIPNGGVWNCLVRGHDDEVRTFRAYAIASLPYGGHAACSMAE